MQHLRGLVPIARSLTFLYVAAVVMTVGSERMFWFWAPGIGTHLEVAAWYIVALAVGVALIRRYRVDSLWSLMLVAPVVAYVVEGVITPVLYSAGPFVPFFPAWFTVWHGVGAFVVLVFAIRKLLLAESYVALTVVSIGLGLFWGVWSTTLWLPENLTDADLLEEHGTLHVLDPSEFARFALSFTVVLMVGHALLGLVWPAATTATASPGRLTRSERFLAVVVLLGATVWTVAAPWALPMFVVYAGIQIVGLRRHRGRSRAETPDLIDQMAGRVRLRALAPLALMAPAAATSYALMWSLDPADKALEVLMISIVGAQTILGAFVIVAAHRAVSRRRDDPPAAGNQDPGTAPPTSKDETDLRFLAEGGGFEPPEALRPQRFSSVPSRVSAKHALPAFMQVSDGFAVG